MRQCKMSIMAGYIKSWLQFLFWQLAQHSQLTLHEEACAHSLISLHKHTHNSCTYTHTHTHTHDDWQGLKLTFTVNKEFSLHFLLCTQNTHAHTSVQNRNISYKLDLYAIYFYFCFLLLGLISSSVANLQIHQGIFHNTYCFKIVKWLR